MDPRTERMLEERRAAREAAGPAPTGARRLWRVTVAAWARWRVAAAVIAAIVLACGGAWYALVTVPAR